MIVSNAANAKVAEMRPLRMRQARHSSAGTVHSAKRERQSPSKVAHARTADNNVKLYRNVPRVRFDHVLLHQLKRCNTTTAADNI